MVACSRSVIGLIIVIRRGALIDAIDRNTPRSRCTTLVRDLHPNRKTIVRQRQGGTLIKR
jgi:hypothetical protein